MKSRKTVRQFLDFQNKKTAEFVVAHAKWQKSRGRKPSESYKKELNPAKALKLALEELRLS